MMVWVRGDCVRCEDVRVTVGPGGCVRCEGVRVTV